MVALMVAGAPLLSGPAASAAVPSVRADQSASVELQSLADETGDQFRTGTPIRVYVAASNAGPSPAGVIVYCATVPSGMRITNPLLGRVDSSGRRITFVGSADDSETQDYGFEVTADKIAGGTRKTFTVTVVSLRTLDPHRLNNVAASTITFAK